MSERQRFGVLCLLVVLSVAMIGCGHEERLPTAATSPNDLGAAAPNLGSRDEGIQTRRGHQHMPPHAVIGVVKQALGAVLTVEQVYYQRWGTFTDVPDTTDLRVRFGLDLGDVLRRWAFSVSGASVTGFVATARGRPHTEAEGIVVTLRYVRGQPLSWVVEDTRHDHEKKRFREPRRHDHR